MMKARIVDEQEYLTVKEAAAYLDKSLGRVYHYMDRGWLPHRTIFNRQVISKADLDRLKATRNPKTGKLSKPPDPDEEPSKAETE